MKKAPGAEGQYTESESKDYGTEREKQPEKNQRQHPDKRRKGRPVVETAINDHYANTARERKSVKAGGQAR